jgi:hypothetical protein
MLFVKIKIPTKKPKKAEKEKQSKKRKNFCPHWDLNPQDEIKLQTNL